MDFLPPDSSDEDDEDEKQITTMKYNNNINYAMVPGYQPQQKSLLLPQQQQKSLLLPQQQQNFVQLTHFSAVNSQHLLDTLHERKPPTKRRKTNNDTKDNKLSDNVEDGPWVSYNAGMFDDDDNSVTIKALSKAERDAREREAMRAEEMEKQKEAAALKPNSSATLGESERQEGAEESIFYGEAERDYQGRPWTTPPSYIDISKSMDSIECFIPKKIVHV